MNFAAATEGFAGVLIPILLVATLVQPALVRMVARIGKLWLRRSAMRTVWGHLRGGGTRSGHLTRASVAPSIRAPGLYADAAVLSFVAVVISAMIWPSGHLIATDLLLGLILTLLGMIDLRWFWLPDRLTLPLCAIGLLAACLEGGGLAALVGSMVGGGLFAGVRWGYRALRGRQGLGLGDVKLAAAMGAWLQTARLLDAIVLAALVGCLVAVIQSVAARRSLSGAVRLPFGPFLVLAMWIAWIAPQGWG